ncbi:hypothetical protein ACUW81_000608 [Staphylococcus borealis]
MVYPLMNSLVHDMIPQPERTHPDISIGKMSYEESVEQALNEENKMNQKQNKNKKSSSKSKKESIKDVRAISRFSIPANYSMEDVAKTYATFINNITLHLINGTINENKFDITLPFMNQFILKMERDMEDSSEDMIVYKIVGGNLALSNNGGNARFEFRRILDTNEAIVALQEYEPTLPWVVYKYTQANIHKTVMELFVNHMNKLAEEDKQASSHNNQLFSTIAMTTGAIVGAYVGSKIYHLIKA